jgi:pimeloyl-ACP methyl ester carboxylesterase
MRSIDRPALRRAAAPTLIVLLPGAYHSPEDFLTAGFDSKVRSRGLPVDLKFIDPELGHLGDRRFREQLCEGIVKPARAQGCAKLWLGGISLGGFMALDYAAAHPGDLDGLCLFAPYLGSRLTIRDIAAGEPAGSEEERDIWRLIQTQAHRRPQPGADRQSPHPSALHLYLGYGAEDRFAAAHRLMAQALPPSVTKVVPGRHDWDTWTTLWEDFLDTRLT